MTEEKKEILIAKILDAPSSLSDEELDLILNDDELRDIYSVSAYITGACIRQPEFDMKAEWNKFRPRLRRKPTAMHWIMRVAAIFLGVLLASSIVVKIIDSAFTDDRRPVIAKVEKTPTIDNEPDVHHNIQVSKSEEAPEIKQRIERNNSGSNRHLTEAETSHPGSTVSQDESDIDVDEFLRIQEACIDNDLAMQVAESYAEEYDDLATLLDAVGTHNPELDIMIKKVTME